MRTAWRPLVLISCEMLWVLGRATPAAAATARGGVHARHALYRELYLGGGNGRRRPGVGAGQRWPGAGVWRSFGLLSDVEERGRGGAQTSSPVCGDAVGGGIADVRTGGWQQRWAGGQRRAVGVGVG
jgi:hypothetical protein